MRPPAGDCSRKTRIPHSGLGPMLQVFQKKPANIYFLLAGEVEFMTLYRETLPMLTSSIHNAPGPEFSSL